MKTFIRNSVWIFLILLLAGNITVFVWGIKISDSTRRYDKEMSRLHIENMELEKKIFGTESLANTASQAAKLKFVEITTPYILDNTKYAFNR